jgi:hypothetical protein
MKIEGNTGMAALAADITKPESNGIHVGLYVINI